MLYLYFLDLDFIKSYIALEKLQLPSNVSLSFVIEGKLASQQVIAPMLLLTFVENCFKHYNKNGKTERFIRVHIHIKDSSLYLRTSNTFKANVFNEHALDKKEKSGLGLKNVVQSLDIIYKKRYALEVEEEENVFYTTLKVPLNEDSL